MSDAVKDPDYALVKPYEPESSKWKSLETHSTVTSVTGW